MATRKPISWFLTDQGRKFSFALVTGTGMALTAAQFAPHSFLLDRYKNFVHYYSNGIPVELPKELNDRYEQCIQILKLPEIHKKLITPFSVFGYDLFHAGSTKSKFGVAVGIPVNFTYKSMADLEKDNIQVNLKKVDWESEIGQQLADALILPEKVQQFALCREILMSHNSKFIIESTYPFASVFIAYNLSQYMNKRLNLYAAPAAVRGCFYGIIGAFSIGTYFLFKDMTEVYYETSVDEKLCELGEDFIESGVIFYDKLMKRNQALRELMGSEGQRKYSKLGNENFGLRHPRTTLMHRKQFFEEKLKEAKGENPKKFEGETLLK